jgi:hypothetical protein
MATWCANNPVKSCRNDLIELILEFKSGFDHQFVQMTSPPWVPITAQGKHSYDPEYQLPTEAP